MLLALAQWLAQDMRAFNVFNYITLRAVLATLTALLISFVVGPAMIKKLTAYKIGQAVRDDGPSSHLSKVGTPTMGGALILGDAAGHAGLRPDWLGRRLSKSRAARSAWAIGAEQVFLAVVDRSCRRAVSCF